MNPFSMNDPTVNEYIHFTDMQEYSSEHEQQSSSCSSSSCSSTAAYTPETTAQAPNESPGMSGGSNVAQLELDILYHPDIKSHLEAVCLYLRMDLTLLESISYLRQEGLWRPDISQPYGAVQRPKTDQMLSMASIHQSLFHSPPTDLFDLICDLRRFTGFGSRTATERLPSLLEQRYLDRRHRSYDSMKTAPSGRLYACPSSNCRKTFKKSGHARNHVETKHLEYLQLNPDYLPQQFVVNVTTGKLTLVPTKCKEKDLSAAKWSFVDGNGRIKKRIERPVHYY